MGPAPCEPCASPGGGREGEKPPPGGTPAGGTPAGGKPAAKQQERGSSPRPQGGTGGRVPPAAGGGAPPWPRGSGGRGQGARAKARERRAAPAGGATGPGPPKGGWGPLPRSAEKGPATLGRAGPHTEIVCGPLTARKHSAEGWGGCAPSVGPDGPGPNAAPVSGPLDGPGKRARSGAPEEPPTNPHQSGVEARRPEPKGKGSGRPGRPAQGLPEPQDGPERAGADGPDGPRRPDDAGI